MACYHPTPLSLPRAAPQLSHRSRASDLSLLSLSPFPLNSQSSKSLAIASHQSFSTLKPLCVSQSKAPVVTRGSWKKEVLSSEVPVLVEFYASWCGPCRMVHRVIDDISEEYSGKLKCFMINTDDDPQIAEDYEIKAVPVVLLFNKGQQCEIVAGTMPKEFYVAAIERVLKS